MAVRLGNIEPVNFMLGSKQVEELRLGEQLVWKRRLIEGYDYERYDWLKGEQSAGFSPREITIHVTHNTLMECEFKFLSKMQYGILDKDNKQINRLFVDSNANPASPPIKIDPIAGFYNHVYTQVQTKLGTKIKTLMKSGIAEIWQNDSAYRKLTWEKLQLSEMNYNNNTRLPSMGLNHLKTFRFTEEGNVLFSLVPCKLLRHCPANLNNQGVARQAGTCGMIEEVSGILYTDATGSFSVYND